MRERPILFSGPMVRAILDGRKTQTRRVMTPQPPCGTTYVIAGEDENRALCISDNESGEFLWPIDPWRKCPYGVPGDRLWVKEAWQPYHAAKEIYYPANGAWGIYPDQGDWFAADWERRGATKAMTGRPSIHMPRWASRLTLEITRVRVERVQEISEADARAEGVDATAPLYGDSGGYQHEGHKETFRSLWDSINGKRKGCSWADNPWVWVIKFRKLEGGAQ